MGATYNVGEQKIRPGVYRRYEKAGTGTVPGAIYGIFAIPVQADFGPLGTVMAFEPDQVEELKQLYGTGGTVDAALALFEGGATKVFVYRLGSGGSKASASYPASSNLKLETKYETAATDLSFTVRKKLGDSTVKEFLLYAGIALLEKIEFLAGTNDSDALFEAINANSKYLSAVKMDNYSSTEAAEVSGTTFTGGAAPSVTTESYSVALTAFEAFKWNMLVLDTVDTAVHALVNAYMDRVFEDGILGVCALGEPTTIDFETRCAHAKAFNNEKFIYLGSGYEDADGNKIDGYLAIAKQAGIIGSMESNTSATHTVVPGAVNTLERLTNSQYERAILSGMLLLSPNSEGQVWFDSGINTLVTPGENQDEGWKKIRRTATRFEVFDRIDRAVAPVIGKVNCDDIGIGDVVVLGQSVLDAMVKEGKFMSGATFAEDSEFRRGADYGFFVIDAVDIDSLEKIYLRYRFRFSAE